MKTRTKIVAGNFLLPDWATSPNESLASMSLLRESVSASCSMSVNVNSIEFYCKITEAEVSADVDPECWVEIESLSFLKLYGPVPSLETQISLEDIWHLQATHSSGLQVKLLAKFINIGRYESELALFSIE